MLDRLHLELLHLLPDGSLRENSYLNIGPKSRSSIVTSVFGGTLQSEVCLHIFQNLLHMYRIFLIIRLLAFFNF